MQDLTSLSHMVRDKPNNHTKGREILLVNTTKSVLNPPFQTPLKSLLLAHPNPGCKRCSWLQHLQEMQPKEQFRQTVSLCQLVNTGVHRVKGTWGDHSGQSCRTRVGDVPPHPRRAPVACLTPQLLWATSVGARGDSG